MTIYTLEEVKDLFKVSPDTIRRAIKKGDMQVLKIGRLLRITDEQLTDFMLKRTLSNSKRKKQLS